MINSSNIDKFKLTVIEGEPHFTNGEELIKYNVEVGLNCSQELNERLSKICAESLLYDISTDDTIIKIVTQFGYKLAIDAIKEIVFKDYKYLSELDYREYLLDAQAVLKEKLNNYRKLNGYLSTDISSFLYALDIEIKGRIGE